MDDLGLVAAVRAGDDRAFELLFARYQGRITAYVRGMVRDHGRAEDVTQEVFIAALRRMRETDREIVFKPWIYEIAKNACIDAFRRARNVREVSIDAREGLGPADQGCLVAPGLAADAVLDTKLAIDDLCGAFGGLSQTHHDILVMREFDGLSYREIGDRLDMSRAAVESTLFRARRRLGEEYGEIASGERCLRVRCIVDAREERAVGLRDRRRMARHLSHCQPCRRYAHQAGIDLDTGRAASSAVARVAAMLPLPAFLRRRLDIDDPGQLLGAGHGVPLLHWSPSVVSALDPLAVSGWSKAVVTAATVAVAGLGAGAAVRSPHALHDVVSQGRSIVGLGHRTNASGSVRAVAAPSTVGALRVDRRTAAAVARRSSALVRHPSTATGSIAAGQSEAASHTVPDAMVPKLTQRAESTVSPKPVAAAPDKAASGGSGGTPNRGDGASGLPVGTSTTSQAATGVSGVSSAPLSLVDAILQGRTGANTTTTTATTSEASAGAADDVGTMSASGSESNASSPGSGSADLSVSVQGSAGGSQGTPLTVVGHVVGAVTGAVPH